MDLHLLSCSVPPAPILCPPEATAVVFFFGVFFFALCCSIYMHILPCCLFWGKRNELREVQDKCQRPGISHYQRGRSYATDGCRQRPWLSSDENHNNKKQPWQPMTSLSVHVINATANGLFASACLCTAHLLAVSLSHYVISF